MLVLSRHRDEEIMIGDDISIVVVDIRGDKTRIGITAPEHVKVHRREVFEAIYRETHGKDPEPRPKPVARPNMKRWAGGKSKAKREKAKAVDRSDAALRLYNQQHPEEPLESLSSISLAGQSELLAAVDAVLGSGA